MAVVAISLLLNVRAHRAPEIAPRFPAAERNRGDRKVQATQDRVQQERLSGQAAALYSLRSRELTTFKMNKKERRLALKSALTSKSE